MHGNDGISKTDQEATTRFITMHENPVIEIVKVDEQSPLLLALSLTSPLTGEKA